MNFNFKTKHATPEWLTSILVRNGFLSRGEVASVEHDTPELANQSFISTFISLKLTYTQGSLGRKPPTIVLKAIKPELVKPEEHRELRFYTAVLDFQAELPLLTCFGTAVCPETNQYCLLLEDLTTTHHQPQYPVPPIQDECEEAITTLASIHAFWMDHSCLGDSVFVRPSEEKLEMYFELCEGIYPRFVDHLGDRLPKNRRDIFQRVFEKAPKLIWNLISPEEKQTVTHGDAHFWNFLYPDHKHDTHCVIFDWQSWGIGIPAKDLAYMMAYQWYPDRRKRMELPLLKHYLTELNKRQIHCNWEDLLIDYRVCVIMNLLTPVLWQSYDYPPNIWWNHHEKSFASFEDLDCMAFL